MFWRPLALTLAANGSRLIEALRYAELDLVERPDHGAWATRGWVRHRLGRHQEAVADMERALTWDAPGPMVLYLAGRVFAESGDPRRGRPLLRQALGESAELGPVMRQRIEAALSACRL